MLFKEGSRAVLLANYHGRIWMEETLPNGLISRSYFAIQNWNARATLTNAFLGIVGWMERPEMVDPMED